MAWDNPNTHEDDEIEVVLRAAAGRLVLLYLPIYSPWLNPIEMLWRPFRREVIHCERFPNVKALIAEAYEFFECYPMSVAGPLDHRFEPRENYVNVLSGTGRCPSR